ncbi:hypothetical protein SLEP1_g43609 [Rubroshorea leprosula]|uniref:Uncharacterized protein n=1 Tax=Rubroshorea leprosula TaxID=152421 RepID=A0AAV5LDH4_9ROSI|nr:hypothetical protein SLEP1_g43609 [Rubroshorea leprosula]
MERTEYSRVNIMINSGDGNIMDSSQDHSTNIGAHSGARTKNTGFNAGANNSGPGAGGINNNHGPGAGGINSGAGAGSINADSIKGGVQFEYHNPIPMQKQYYSPQPTWFPDNQTGSMNYPLPNDPIPYDPTRCFNHNPDFDLHSYYHSAAGSRYQNSLYHHESYYHHKSTASSESDAEGEDVMDYNNLDSIIRTAPNKGVRSELVGNTLFLFLDD